MRQKFGNSDGLRATGKMTGIGSDASYDPNGPQTHDITNHLSAVTLNAYSFLSSTVSAIGENIKAGTENKGGGGGNNSTNGGGNSKPREGMFGALTKNAVGLWQHAAVVTSDLVQSITTPEEEVSKFPRGDPRFREPVKKEEGSFYSRGGEDFDRQTTVNDPYAKNSQTSNGNTTSRDKPATVFESSNRSVFNDSQEASRDSSRVNSKNDLSSMLATNSAANSSSNSLYRSTDSPEPKSAYKSDSPSNVSSSSGTTAVGKGGLNAKKLAVTEDDDFFGSFGI
jgi:hypothetical protein